MVSPVPYLGAPTSRRARHLGASAYGELREHGGHVVAHGLRRHHQPIGDLGVREPQRDETGDLPLPLGQATRVRSSRRSRPARDGAAELAKSKGDLVRHRHRAEPGQLRVGQLDIGRVGRASLAERCLVGHQELPPGRRCLTSPAGDLEEIRFLGALIELGKRTSAPQPQPGSPIAARLPSRQAAS